MENEFELDSSTLDLLKNRFGLVGASPKMLEVFRTILRVAPTDLNVLITGETGTGKEVIANAIHQLSKRKKYPFISVNCGAIPETLLESELFGHEKGAFTGAYEQRKGYFEVANRGTIFLDEIGEMPVGTQVKLLRVLETGEFNRLGSTEVRKVDVRVIAATNRILEEEIYRGTFRQDLFYRLKNLHIILPPLREHPEDIPLLAEYFAQKTCERLGIPYKGFAIDAVNFLRGLPWQGNVRELRNLIETIIQLEKTGFLSLDIVKKYIPPALPPHIVVEQPKETSLLRIETAKEAQIGLEIVLRTLFELKKDVDLVKDALNELNSKIDSLNSNVMELKPNSYQIVDASDSLSFDKDNLNLEEIEKNLISFALKKFKGNRRLTAKALGISERTLYRKINQYNLD
ncbi:sigma-54-dependent Fis family transcriptional regulator [Bacteroidetes/Chlorobi group bacterium MS-B_bin-24]|jgi:DNA-binding NtrC family response regulator|nr:MAG: sigma-54-dependent Fis family transcriptional regulator [Bacteroidetes/Chlorobi group bacterium MS-B_bin-24]